jgi:acyl-CoA thioesterase
MMHPLDVATSLVRLDDNRLSGETSDDYWNFAGPFGGYVAALLMRAVMTDARRLGPPVAQTVNYCGAMNKGAFEISLSLDRGGKATQHWSLRLTQGDLVMATATIVCANRRETFAHIAVSPPEVPPPDAIAAAPAIGRLPWLSAYEFRFIEGGPQFGATPIAAGELGSPKTKLWLADKPARPLDFVSLAALSDCFILRLVQMRRTMVPMGTVSMTTYFHAAEDELAAQGSVPLLGIADAKRFNANFHDQSMELWGSGGKLLANGLQTVWYKE